MDIPEFFKSRPSYRPSPIPHLILPAPNDDFCLTTYYPTDLPDLTRLATHPKIVPYLGVSGPDDPNLEHECKYLDEWLRKPKVFAFQVLRETAKVQASSWSHEEGNQSQNENDDDNRPKLIGTISFGRNAFGDLPAEDKQAMREREATLPDEEGNWMTTLLMLDPEYGGRGLMTAAYKFALSEWFIPSLHPKPGQLAAGWSANNMAGRKLHERVGFEIMGRRPPGQALPKGEEGGGPTVVAIWQGSGKVLKGDSIYKGIPDFVYDD